MLFGKKSLESKYELEKEIEDKDANLTELSKDIDNIVSQMLKLKDKNTPIILAIDGFDTDIISIEDISVKEIHVGRTPKDIRDILYRSTDDRTSIAGKLRKLGVREPREKTEEYKDYLKLLYLFYMLDYVVFAGENLFKHLSERNLSSAHTPIKGSANGKYIYIIERIFFTNKNIFQMYLDNVLPLIHMENQLIDLLGEYINQGNSIDQNNKAFHSIKDFYEQIDDTKSQSVFNKMDTSPVIMQVLYLLYALQKRAYVKDMLNNLFIENKQIFLVEELNIEMPEQWKSESVNILISWLQHEEYTEQNEVSSFLKNQDLVYFCMQEKTKRTDRLETTNAVRFLKNMILYALQFMQENGSEEGFFIEEKGSEHISILKADIAILIKTYIDFKNEPLLIRYVQEGRMRTNCRLGRVLGITQVETERNSMGVHLEDLAMKLWYMAYQSEWLNVYAGYGYYYPLFRCIELNKYRLLYEMIEKSFDQRTYIGCYIALYNYICYLRKE